MKVLVSDLETMRTYVTREFYHILSEIISNHGLAPHRNLQTMEGPGTIRDKLINEFRQLPENERNHEELDEIRRNGQKLVWERHKTVDRARQINAGCSA